jgi:hypothetical protein
MQGRHTTGTVSHHIDTLRQFASKLRAAAVEVGPEDGSEIRLVDPPDPNEPRRIQVATGREAALEPIRDIAPQAVAILEVLGVAVPHGSTPTVRLLEFAAGRATARIRNIRTLEVDFGGGNCNKLSILAAALEKAALDADRGESRQPELAKPAVVDGPIAPDGFRFSGRAHHGLTTKPFAMLSVLWGAPNRTASFKELAEPVWGDREEVVTSEQVGTHRKALNSFFDAHSQPFKVSISGEYVTLKENPAG